MYKLVLLRHGESVWNKENRFTGWTDVDLSEKGVNEAKNAGKYLKEKGFVFDITYTSVLKRAIRTLWITLEEIDLMWLPIIKSWRLNERHYGALQGMYKSETAKKYGEERVLNWRRSYNIKPPLLEKIDKRYPRSEICYKNLKDNEIPVGESLHDTYKRFMPFWKEEIAPTILSGKKVLIVAHGNSLLALVKFLDNLSDEDILHSNIPTGLPLVYELDKNLKPIDNYYLGDPKDVKRAIDSVADQGKVM